MVFHQRHKGKATERRPMQNIEEPVPNDSKL